MLLLDGIERGLAAAPGSTSTRSASRNFMSSSGGSLAPKACLNTGNALTGNGWLCCNGYPKSHGRGPQVSLLVAHLTDIHCMSPGDAINSRAEQVANAVLSEADGRVEAIHLVIGGDAAQAGDKQGFDVAKSLIDQIVMILTRARPSTPCRVILVPGNHDCDFAGDQSMREIALGRLEQTLREHALPPESMEPVLLQPLENYFEFASKLAGGASPSKASPYYVSLDTECGSHTVRYHLFNTAWMSTRSDSPGTLLFPLSVIPSSASDGASVQLCVYHHPVNWFKQPSTMRPFRDAVENLGDLILTAHEHSGLVYGKEIYGRSGACYVEGAVLQERGRPDISGFHTILLDLSRRHAIFTTYSWVQEASGGHYARLLGPVGMDWQPVAQRTGRLRLRPEFESYLDDPGLPVNHRSRGALRLTDFYTWPDLRVLDEALDASAQRVRADSAVTTILANDHIVIVAPDKGGRTSFAKRLFAKLHEFGLAPLLVNGSALPRSGRPETLRQRLHEYVASQYEAISGEAYEQLPLEKRVLIVDDLQRAPRDGGAREACLAELHARFGKCIFLTNEHFYFSELLAERDAASTEKPCILENYEHLLLLPFGFQRREQFVRRWVSLSPSSEGGPIDERVDEILRIVDDVLRTNSIPHHPWVVLVLVQSADSPDAPAAENGSYGHLLNAVITAALSRSRDKKLPINGKYSYLGALAHRLFVKGLSAISEDDARAFHAEYIAAYGLPHIGFESLIDDLVEAGLLDILGGEISFHHKYTYCFFVAWHLAQLLNEQNPSAAELVRELSGQLFHEATADIIVFLANLTTAKVVLQEILARAVETYRDIPPTDLVEDVKQINRLNRVVASFVLPEGNPEQHRQRLKEQQDDVLASQELNAHNGRMVEPKPSVPKELAADEAYKRALQATSAFRTIEILGQILRNGATTRKLDEKALIANEVFLLGRRILAFFFRQSPAQLEAVISRLRQGYQDRYPEASAQEIADEVTGHLFNLFGFVTFATIKLVANAVGDEDLDETFRRVLGAESGVPNQLYDIAIKLDRPSGKLPVKQTIALDRLLSKNALVANVLRSLVVEHVYLYRVSVEEKQSICEQLNIKIQKKALDPSQKKLLS